jgi:hypothetical protein
MGEAVFVEGEVLGVLAEQMWQALVADLVEGFRGWSGEVFREEVEDRRSEPWRHDVRISFEVLAGEWRTGVFRVGKLDDFGLFPEEVVQGVGC